VQTLSEPSRILFVYLAPERSSRVDLEINVTEMWQLVSTLGNAQVIDLITQKGEAYDTTYIGPGKAEEVGEFLKTNPTDIIIFNGPMKPSQKFALMKKYWDIRPNLQIWDRVDLILAIFSLHARTTEAKLQIELARMHSMGPRIYGMGKVLSRQSGGIGTRGIGETNTELMKRHWKREIKRAEDALAASAASRKRQMDHRKDIGLQTISIVGYTNAGKTSLFNILTHKKHLVENALFATLDSSVGEIFMPSLGKKVLISDTIGFIANLPPSLIEAFKSTLTESVHADVILHVIDVSDPLMLEKISVVNEILDQLEILESKEVLVFNKIDAATDLDKQKISEIAGNTPYIFISTKTKDGIEELTSILLPRLIQPNSIV
jgi:GTPase